MTSVATYVFVDLETTGLPVEENNRTKITEISLVAVKREHILDTRPGATPRVQQKLTLCFNPGRLISPSCSDVTGLCNDLLEHEPYFNMQVFDMLNNFLNILTKPVCLIAQNGYNFDFPILKNHLEKMKVSFSEDLLCADCFHGFYHILEERKSSQRLDLQTNSNPGPQIDMIPTGDKKTEISRDEVDLLSPNTLPMKSINETTPKQAPKPCASTPRKDDNNRVSKAKKRFPWSNRSKPTEKYKLKDIYERVLNRPAVNAHRAENDCILALEVAVALVQDFVKWIDENYVPFSEIKPMTIGVRLGD